MITHIDIVGLNLQLGEDIKKYIRSKIGRVDRYLPKAARQKDLRAEVKINQTNNRTANKYECEVILHVPGDMITAKESTVNMFAAVDIVEEKLKNQCVKYKSMHQEKIKSSSHGILRRLRQGIGWSRVVR